ncbi:MAG: hypothetical protein PHT69_09470 [Bacteroidales bacterium]|nr:hypothetical protein [Bacteroidales bacterium]
MKKWIFLLILSLIYLLILIAPFVPLPMAFSDKLYIFFISGYKIITISIPFIILGGLIISSIIIVFFKKNRRNGIRILFYLFFMFILSVITNQFFIPRLVDFSRGYAIRRAELLIKPLEKYKNDNGTYPNFVSELVPNYIDKLPFTKIISVPHISYKKAHNSYNLMMGQRINGWDVEIILYNSNDEYDSTLKLKRHGNWRYYIVEQ